MAWLVSDLVQIYQCIKELNKHLKPSIGTPVGSLLKQTMTVIYIYIYQVFCLSLTVIYISSVLSVVALFVTHRFGFDILCFCAYTYIYLSSRK